MKDLSMQNTPVSMKNSIHRESANNIKLKLKEPIVEKANQPHPAALFQQAQNDAGSLTSRDIAQLHRSVGNQAVGKLLSKTQSPPVIQAKLTSEGATYAYEQEADRIATQVSSAPGHAPAVQHPVQKNATPTAASIAALNRHLASDEPLTPDADFTSQLATARSGGKPLNRTTRDFMERRFGADFKVVRLYSGSQAARLTMQIGAQAFTHGQDIFLAEGKEDVESGAGKQLLAHELAHVVQQNRERVIRMPWIRSNNSPSHNNLFSSTPNLVGTKTIQLNGGGNKKGTFIGEPNALHLHIDIARPHFKIGMSDKNRIDIGTNQEYNKKKLEDVIDAIKEHPGVSGYEECLEWCLTEARRLKREAKE
jgi:hypothetical protein